MSAPARNVEPSVWGLALAAFLAPLLGGQISLDPLPLEPGGLASALLREPSAATLAHFLVFLPLLLALVLAFLKRKVVQVPHLKVVVATTLFALFLLVSVAMSEYRSVSMQLCAEWLAYLVALFAGIALTGRGVGPRVVAGSFVAGASIVAIMAIREYLVQPDPTWRVIANWLNPNALAALLTMALLAALGFCGESGRGRLLGYVGSALCLAALLLTQSKGGLLAAGVGTLVFVIALALQSRPATVRGFPRVAVALAIGGALGVGLTFLHPNRSAQQSALNRVVNAGATQTQSAGFRALLWKGSVELIKDNPMGRGLGTYRFHSAKPGLTTQTHLAHQSYLQIGVETGVGGLLAFAGLLVVCLYECLKGWRSGSPTSRHLRAGLLAALVSLATHAMLDSDFSHFGLGFAFFLLLGVLFQLSSDASVPEFAPAAPRLVAVTVAGVAGLMMAYFGVAEVSLGTLRYALGNRDAALAQRTFDQARRMLPFDARVWTLGASIASSNEERIQRLQTAVRLGPTPAIYRQLAASYEAGGDSAGAERALRAALRIDPNNLPALMRLMETQRQSNPEAAKQTARQLISIEDTPYFKVRAIPEIVPLETYAAREFLAESLAGEERRAMLLPAAKGYAQFARSTVPSVVMFAKAGMDGGFGAITASEARNVLERAAAICAELSLAEEGEAVQQALSLLP